MTESDVVLATIVNADGTSKKRPAIVLREIPPFKDLLLCGATTQLHNFEETLDEFISPIDSDFRTSGLIKKSVIRLGFLAVFPKNRVMGKIGSINKERHVRLLRRLSNYLIQNCKTN
ncbi:MAG: type II toxin-antitoxin system PemK/MazF family toxin [Nitrospinae bacterium]|nr:type II toxin-antitoxin system PemK/MazF family toxin [Nitrospinota bacterium]